MAREALVKMRFGDEAFGDQNPVRRDSKLAGFLRRDCQSRG